MNTSHKGLAIFFMGVDGKRFTSIEHDQGNKNDADLSSMNLSGPVF